MFIVLHFKYTAVRCYKSSIAPKEPLVKCRAILLHNTIFEPSLNSSRLPWCVLFIFVMWQLQIQIMKIDVSWVGQWITLGTLYCILSLCFAETLVHVRRALDAVLTSPHTSPPNLPKPAEIQRKREIRQKWGIREKWANRAELKCGLARQPRPGFGQFGQLFGILSCLCVCVQHLLTKFFLLMQRNIASNILLTPEKDSVFSC